MSDKGYTYKEIKKEKNNITFEVLVSKELFEKNYEVIFKKESKSVKVAGFRPGMAPKAEIEKRIGVDVINETVNTILPQVAFEILVEKEITPISGVKYDLKKINEDSSVEFEFSVSDSPKVDITKISKIKVEQKKEEVKDEEVEMVIRNIIQSTLPEEFAKLKEGEELKISDEMVAKLGYEDEKTYDGLKAKVRETLERVKEEQSENEYAQKVLEEAVKLADFFIPEDLVEDEIHHREHHFEDRLKKLKLDKESYLKTQNKSMDDIRNEWRKEIERNAGVDILTINLAKQEKLVPTEEEIEAEIEKIEDEITRIRYRSDERLRDQMRTIISRNRGVQKIIDLSKNK